MRFRSKKIGLLVLTIAFGLMAMGSAVTTSLVQWDVTIQNNTVTTYTDTANAFNYSSQSQYDSGYITSDALNAHIHGDAGDIPFMPGTKKLRIEKSINRSGANDTADANSTTANDIELPYLINETYDIAFHNRSNALHLNIGTVTDHDVDLTFYYCDTSDAALAPADQCDSWVALTGVNDQTNKFTLAGTRSIQWTLPSSIGVNDWVAETHQDVKAYWIRIKVTTVNSAGTTPPLGTQTEYETGQWIVYTDSLDAGITNAYELYTGGAAISTYHFYFPGYEGVVVPYNANMEPGSEWNLDISQNFVIDTNEDGKVFGKSGGLNLDYDASASAGANNTLILTAPPATASTFAGVWTHSEEDGTSYYSGTSEESYSKGFFNGASNYKTAREENDADIVSNTDSSVTSTKVGQAYDKTTETTSAFGAKINDPS